MRDARDPSKTRAKKRSRRPRGRSAARVSDRPTFVADVRHPLATEGLTKVVICNRSNGSSYRASSFEDGVLTIDHKPTTNIDYIDDRVKGLQAIMEAAL